MWGALIGAGISALASSGSKGSAKAVDLLTAEERRLRDAAAKWLQQYIGKGAEPYTGELTADIPELFTDAYNWYQDQFGRADVSDAIKNLISGKPAYTYDPAATTKMWEETYATPVMSAWKQTVLPIIKERLNVPGRSTVMERKTLDEMGAFYGQHVAPTLFGAHTTGQRMGFESAEAAAARVPEAVSLPAKRMGEAASVAEMLRSLEKEGIMADYQEFLRTRAEPGWATSAALGFSPSRDVVGFQGSNLGLTMLAGGLAGQRLFEDVDWGSLFM